MSYTSLERTAAGTNTKNLGSGAPVDVEVTCATREPLQNPHTGVTQLGTPNRRWTRGEIIEAIEAGTHTFHVQTAGGRDQVAVYDGPFSQYLRARRNGQWNDVLLALAECAE